MSLLVTSFLTRTEISPTVVQEGKDKEDEEEWLTCIMYPWGWWMSRKNLSSQEPRLERSSLCCRLSEFRHQWDVVFDHWSIRKSTRFHRKAYRATILLACSRGLSLSRIFPTLWHTQLPLHAFCTSPLAVMTIVGLHDFVKVFISALLKSFLLIMCIDAPESTTNSLSSGFNVDASKHLFSGDEKNVAL